MTTLMPQLILTFSVGIVAIFVCNRIGIPAILGLLITGILVGPGGFGLLASSSSVHTLAELGIVLLLFSIGTEFSLRSLLKIKYSVLIGGGIQTGLTTVITYISARALGINDNLALLLGFLISLSSTALVVSILKEKAEMDTASGRTTFAILLFQDLIIVPVMLIIPLLGDGVSAVPSPILLLGKGVFILISVLVSASWLIPRVLKLSVATEDKEVFLLTIIVICFSVAYLTQKAGLSFGLGALLAGLIISESEYSHYTIGAVIPFQQVFVVLFFVSIGMLLDVNYFWSNAPLIVFLSAVVVLGKSLLALPSAIVLGLPLRSSLLSAFALAQIGEFSFVVAEEGLKYAILSEEGYQLVLSVSILTIAATPFVIRISSVVSDLALRLPLPQLLKSGWLFRDRAEEAKALEAELTGHAIIVGFGVAGRTVVAAAEAAHIPYVVLDLSVAALSKGRAENRAIFYGDATHPEVLLRYGVRTASALVVTVLDPLMARRIVARTKTLNPNCHVMVRTALCQEVQDLKARGADEVVVEELETGSALARGLTLLPSKRGQAAV